MFQSPLFYFLFSFSILFLLALVRGFNIVPQRKVYIVERLGKYHRNLYAGLNLIVPFIDRISYKHSLKERAIDVPVQSCITKDNITVEVDAILYMKIIDPEKASYGIHDYLFATTQISQTTMRSVIGKLDLDQTFEERERINAEIVKAVDKASDPWGIKVTRYEIKDIKPPQTIKDAMEKQMRAEREKRAVIAQSEGEKQAHINIAEGSKLELIARSEGEKQKRINEAEGHAIEITETARAISESLYEIGKAIQAEGGKEAVSLRLSEQYLKQFGKLAQTNNTMIIPSNLTDISSIIAAATSVYKNTSAKQPLETLLKKSIK